MLWPTVSLVAPSLGQKQFSWRAYKCQEDKSSNVCKWGFMLSFVNPDHLLGNFSPPPPPQSQGEGNLWIYLANESQAFPRQAFIFYFTLGHLLRYPFCIQCPTAPSLSSHIPPSHYIYITKYFALLGNKALLPLFLSDGSVAWAGCCRALYVGLEMQKNGRKNVSSERSG